MWFIHMYEISCELKEGGGLLLSKYLWCIHTYPIHIFGTNISSMNKEIFHYIQMALFCCHMQRSPLIETRNENNTAAGKLLKLIQKIQAGVRVTE